MPQLLQRGFLEAFALGRVRMDGCGDVFEPRAHLDRQAEDRRQFGDAGADCLDAEQQMIVGAGDDADESILPAQRSGHGHSP